VEKLLIVFVHREDDDPGLGVAPLEDTGHLQAAHQRHVDVDEHDVWYQHICHLHGSLAVAGFAHDEDVGLVLQAPTHAAPEQGMIVNDQDLDAIHVFPQSANVVALCRANRSGRAIAS
jgi:hypothetical protein